MSCSLSGVVHRSNIVHLQFEGAGLGRSRRHTGLAAAIVDISAVTHPIYVAMAYGRCHTIPSHQDRFIVSDSCHAEVLRG